jgi:hypothetical protein
MKLLDIVHPAAKTLVDIARSQDAEVSDLIVRGKKQTENLDQSYLFNCSFVDYTGR